MFDAQVDHVAVAVRDIRSSMRVFCDALGAQFLFAGDVESQGFRFAQFRFPLGGKFELVTPIGDGFVRRFLEMRGEGVHHVTLKTPDIFAAIDHFTAQGLPLLNVSTDHEQWKEAFVHPKDAHGVLIQVAQAAMSDEEMAHHHLSDHREANHTHIGVDDL